MVQAYILIQTEVGQAADVAQQIRALAGGYQAEDVTGPYDVIARVSAPTMDDLTHTLITQVQSIKGVTRTLTCTVVAAAG